MSRPPRAPLIAIEGIDGTGKTTLQHALAKRWRDLGLGVVELQEPSKGATGRRARRATSGDPWNSAMAFTEDRRRHRAQLERILSNGKVALSDRSFYSTLAYQGSALPARQRSLLSRIQRRATLVPDRVVLLTLPLKVSEARLSRRGGLRAPTERLDVLRRAAREYRRLARRGRWIVLDARHSPDELVAKLHRRLTLWVLHQAAPPRRRA